MAEISGAGALLQQLLQLPLRQPVVLLPQQQRNQHSMLFSKMQADRNYRSLNL